MSDFDLIVRGGMVVDGTGLSRRRVDVGVRGGRIAQLGHLAGASAATELDADGLVVAPGIIDAHTHYDPQITFDPYAAVSCYHGVTTVVAGNCGFSMAPCRPDDRPFLTGIFAAVENMDPVALSGVAWDEFETFPEYLDSRRGKLGVNLACYVGHSNLRRWVMGEGASERTATPDEVGAMEALLAEAMAGGAAGLSSSASPTHLDIDDRPVPSRLAARDELARLAAALGRIGSGSIAFLPQSSVGGLDDEDKDYLIELARLSGLPVITQGLGGRNKTDAPTATWESSVAFLDRASREGAPVYSLLLVRPFDRRFTLGGDNLYYLSVPSWHSWLKMPPSERLAALDDPARRDEMRHAVEGYNRDPAKGTTTPPPVWDSVFVERVALPENKRFESRTVVDVAAELGVAPGDAVLDLARSEGLATEFRWFSESPEWTEAVAEAQLDPRMVLGMSDGGAHLARDDGADWSSYFLGSWVREREVWGLEEAVRQLTQVPAALLGFRDRGTIAVGQWADMMVFDPDAIAPLRKETVPDLPGGVSRVKAWGTGVHATIVNGEPIVVDGELTDRLPGQVVAPAAGAGA